MRRFLRNAAVAGLVLFVGTRLGLAAKPLAASKPAVRSAPQSHLHSHFHHHQRTPAKCTIPTYEYGHDTPRVQKTQFAVVDAPVGDLTTRRRMAHFRATSLTVDHLELDQVGMALYQADGQLMAKARITHRGGDGGLIGNNVVIRLRAYVANSADPTRIPADAVVVWESEQKLWVSRDRPQVVSLVPQAPNLPPLDNLKSHFDQITHLEVELAYLRDR